MAHCNNIRIAADCLCRVGYAFAFGRRRTVCFRKTYNTAAEFKHGAFKAQGVQLTAKLGYPVTDDLDVYTRLGGMVWRADSTQTNPDNGRISNHDTGVSPLAAVGVEYALTKNWATRLDYQWVNNIGDAGTVGARPDNSMLSVGVSVRTKLLHQLLLQRQLRLRLLKPSVSP